MKGAVSIGSVCVLRTGEECCSAFAAFSAPASFCERNRGEPERAPNLATWLCNCCLSVCMVRMSRRINAKYSILAV